MTLLTGHIMGPPLCETGNGRDGDKLLCNNVALESPNHLPFGVTYFSFLDLSLPVDTHFVSVLFADKYGIKFHIEDCYTIICHRPYHSPSHTMEDPFCDL